MLSKIKPLHLLIVGIALIVIAFFWLNKSVVQDEIIEIDPEPEDTTIKQPRSGKPRNRNRNQKRNRKKTQIRNQ